MATEQVRFYSHGASLAGTLMLPDGASSDHPYGGRVTTAHTTRRAARRAKRIGLSLLCLATLAVGTGAGYEAVVRRRTARAQPPRGRLVDIGGRRLQLDCRGAGAPWPRRFGHAGPAWQGKVKEA